MMRFGTLKRFWIVWVAYWLVFLAQPVNSIYDSLPQAWLLQFLFVVALSLAYLVGASALPLHSADLEDFNQQEVILVIRLGLLLSVLGILFLAYDKLVVQGVDYSQGLAIAREQWVRMGEHREGKVSSLFSVFGYLFGGAYFVSLALAASTRARLSDSKRMLFLFLGFLLLMANSVLTGGRSSILLAVAFVSFSYFSSKRGEKLWRSNMSRFWFAAIAMISAVYLLYVFYARAFRSEVELTAYSLEFLGYLGLEPTRWFVDLTNSSVVGALFALCNLAVSYLTHSFVTTAAIIEYAPNEGGRVIFLHLVSMGAKLDLLSSPYEWFLTGRFPSLPGGLYLQYGLPSLIFVAVVIGQFLGFCRYYSHVVLVR